jgi:hypothetical protein
MPMFYPMINYDPDRFLELSKTIKEAIQRGDIDFFDQIPDSKRELVCRSRTQLLGFIRWYSLLEFTLKNKQILLYRYFVVTSGWNKYLRLEHFLKDAAPVYQFAVEKDDKELIGIFKANRKDIDQKTSQKLHKALCQCNLFKNPTLNSTMTSIITCYIDTTAITLKLR